MEHSNQDKLIIDILEERFKERRDKWFYHEALFNRVSVWGNQPAYPSEAPPGVHDMFYVERKLTDLGTDERVLVKHTIDFFRKRIIKVDEHCDILEYGENKLAFNIMHLDSPKDERCPAQLCYDGGDYAILTKNVDVVLVCGNIGIEMRKSLCKARSVLFAEFEDGKKREEYHADVKYMEHAQIVADELIRFCKSIGN